MMSEDRRELVLSLRATHLCQSGHLPTEGCTAMRHPQPVLACLQMPAGFNIVAVRPAFGLKSRREFPNVVQKGHDDKRALLRLRQVAP
ncbi:hypothetical protein FHS66_000229 [Pacificitalea manganoxidans]|nr:hypothetical protein [Pacificitalea manganoxidans]